MNDVNKMIERLLKKLDKSGLETVYQEMNCTAIDTYINKYTKEESQKQTEDEMIDEITSIIENLQKEAPYNLLAKKMNPDDICLQIAMITKFIQEN